MSPNTNSSDAAVDVGKLQVQVTSQAADYPLTNARIQIANPQSGKVLEEVETDTSGKTTVIDLGAPPLEFSEMPNSEMTDGNKPYTEYNLSIRASGFETTTVEGVQILPQSTALQSIRLRQTGRNGAYSPRSISIAQHVLWGDYPPKIMESEVKPLPESTGLVVLPEPVVPEYVVVHLGLPSDASAQNVWVPFKDYVKNVASSEIYSTWPAQTIRANVLAILSFVLNRVYTEWYRGKGYNFTITNNTAFDQAFSYGRNIFEEISQVVDEVFTTYITRPDIRQPLFTQYCDGVQTKCPKAMEQWGSKYLGDEGYDALGILRNYYGWDIYLEQAKKVQGIPISYPGSTLQVGSSGTPVRTIQEQLNMIATHYPAIPKLRVDGVYGAKTQEAVQTFQKIFNLPQSGIVDFATWYAISNIYVGITKMSEPVFRRYPRRRRYR